MTPEHFRDKLRGVMARRRLTQSQAAALLGVSLSLMEAWLAQPGRKWSREPNRFERHGIIIELVAADLRSNRAVSRGVDWDTVDWSQPTTVLATQLEVALPTVSTRRREYAPETMDAARAFRANRVTDWTAVDWLMPNPQLARLYKCSQETVRSQRLTHAPGTHTSRTLANAATDWTQMDWTRANAEIAESLAINIASVRRQRRAHENKAPR